MIYFSERALLTWCICKLENICTWGISWIDQIWLIHEQFLSCCTSVLGTTWH